MTTDFIPAPRPPKKKRKLSTIAIITLGGTSAVLLVSTLALTSVVSNGHMIVHDPGKTITHTVVQRVPGPATTTVVSTGVAQSDFDACRTAYTQVVSLLAQQTSILQGVAVAASDGFQAVADGDTFGLNDAASRVGDLTTKEQGLSDQINSVDGTACQ